MLLDPLEISGKARLISMHGSYQGIYPDEGLQIVGDAFPEEHPIRDWLCSMDFDDSLISKK